MVQMYHVFKSYDGERYALADVTLTVDRGDFLFLTGPSGAGKTTLLKLIFFDERASSGQILVDGINLQRLKRSRVPYFKRRIGVVFQDFKLLLDRTVFANVALALEVAGKPRGYIEKKVRQVLRLVGLAGKENHLSRKLSGGEQQRVAIARAIVVNPILLLADEPTGNLDEEITMDILELFREIHLRGTTVILATHNKNLISRVPSAKIAMLRGGALVASGLQVGMHRSGAAVEMAAQGR
ncbi:MAG: cell division ATP-binding protein FtsE [Deltaproteobacteria bacterium]|nr:cell division ATP-binding protein FtsE [Deltaproteobacteria bacterium]MBW2070214.1 cell division ATP-binding protein FtsE [Deltaproteobacteria bacterium]